MRRIKLPINTKIIAKLFIMSILLLLLFGMLIYKRIIIINYPSDSNYPVRGVDVSNYQGEINWDKLADQNIDFVFIKATEGSKYKDKQFYVNWDGASRTKLIFGAYHFFSFDSSGITQAENYIDSVPLTKGMLPPVVDIEFYGDKERNIPDKAETTKELTLLLDKLYEHYGVKPIIYATLKSYNLYIKGAFSEYLLWIRNVYYNPQLDLRGKWTFWQYTDRAVLEGYKGSEKYIDMNVYAGKIEELESLRINTD
ncbi:GH25 family lysozyme [Anaerocolumna sp. AGMB13020]|uniref:GH25 family lysozyme n=1 Tax=Anaerocolumna sp. AGMB13020 TaxID=3081750 RepID=UPI00295351DE|nr:GH25 family lysozyme [Anaerocolumna sp. AGMB13020]WOO36039.1 GH25 family lysozyme [Anaerocolumna sp. AGMB13020]